MDDPPLLSEYLAGECSDDAYCMSLAQWEQRKERLLNQWTKGKNPPLLRAYRDGKCSCEAYICCLNKWQEEQLEGIVDADPPKLQEYLAGKCDEEEYLQALGRWRKSREKTNSSMSRSRLDINQPCRPFTVEPRSAGSGRTRALTRVPSTASNGRVSSKRKRQDDEDWLLTHTGRLSFREHKAKEKLLDRRTRSEITRLNPITIEDEEDDSRAAETSTLPTPPASSPPGSEAPVIIIDLQSDDDEDIKLPTPLPLSQPPVKIEQDVTSVDPRQASVDADAHSPHSKNGRVFGTVSECLSLLEDEFKPRQPSGSASSPAILPDSPTVLQDPSTGAWKNKVAFMARSGYSSYPRERTQQASAQAPSIQLVLPDAGLYPADLAGVSHDL